MVVDSNFLQNDKLRQFLSDSNSNFAVLTDYAAMEAYKGNTLVSILKSMAILSEFPRQVIVLKGTQTICGLRGRRAGLQRRLIDYRQTQKFPAFCRYLSAAKSGDARCQSQLLELGREADAQMYRVLRDVEKTAEHLEEVAKLFSLDELRALRTGKKLPDGMSEKISKNIMLIAAFLFRRHLGTQKLPPWSEAPNTFVFRFAVCLYLWALNWISVGGAKGTKSTTFRNDLVDLSFAAYATFFDGLLTSDRKLSELHRNAVKVTQLFAT